MSIETIEERMTEIETTQDDAFAHTDARLALLELREEEMLERINKLRNGCQNMFERFVAIELYLKAVLAANDPEFGEPTQRCDLNG